MNNENQLNLEELFVNILNEINERERDILERRYVLSNDLTKKHTLKKIGDDYNITRERVRQLKERALRKLRKTSRSKHLKTYLG